jgi:hypothetical protein
LQNIPLSLGFSLQGTEIAGIFNVTGHMTFGNFSVQYFPEVQVPPLPDTALFAGGLGALGLLGWRRKRKAAAQAA